jgi:hypothetical protein
MCRVDYYDEYALTLSSSTPLARKEHVCNECRRVVQPGEVYERIVMLCDGDFETAKTCTECVEARKWLLQECGGFIVGQVLEELEEHWDEEVELRSWWLARLIVGMRHKWKYRRIVPAGVTS